jgi:tRNA (guanine10-N2)-dimethyltransferase
MNKSLVILGRQPAIGLAELESLYGAQAINPLVGAAVIDVDPKDIDFSRLGGAMKLTLVLHELDTVDWFVIEKYLLKMVPEHLQYLPDGKLTLGLSTYGLSATVNMLTKTGLTLKKMVKNTGRPVRLVPNKTQALSSAQVIHNQLFGERGWEFVFVRDGQKTIICLTTAEQDIEAYGARDQARPKRDARVGMLPPKLAQNIVNLAAGQAPINDQTVLDPFCGTGVILQEALLMGYNVHGTDLEPRMIDYSIANIAWLRNSWDKAAGHVRIEVGDAQTHVWQKPVDLVAAETFLGDPISQMPDPAKLARLIDGTDCLHYKMLANLHKQLAPGTRLCLAVPAWRTQKGFKHLPTLDQLEKLGYTRMVFEHAKNDDLIYAREDQMVARELVVLVTK